MDGGTERCVEVSSTGQDMNQVAQIGTQASLARVMAGGGPSRPAKQNGQGT